MYTKRLSNPRAWCAAALVFVGGLFAANALADPGDQADPPGRVARISFLRGNVSFQPSGDDQWAEASLNRPLGTGDKVYSDASSRVELEVGSSNVRLDEHSTFTLTNLDDSTAQIELTEGVMNLRVRRAGEGQNIEIDTPTLAFVVNQAGNYRIDVAPKGDSTMVTVFDGGGDVYGENNASYSVRGGNSYRFNDSALRDYEVLDLPQADDFDRWSESRDGRYTRSVASRYVAEDVVGYADLDDNGSWNDEPEYGHVWYPTTVEADWAPYRSGHWSWIDPWGWTWVDSAAWGFAPFHYGRWAYVGNRWGWCPGERRYGSVYAPALVGFAGGAGWGVGLSIRGGGGPVGWFPLGPRDVYVPWYHASRGYFTNVNVRNSTVINNVNITNVYNNYSNGRPISNVNYAYQRNERAITAVSRETFVGARPVGGARVQVNAGMLRNSQVSSRVGIAPTQASFIAAGAARGRAAPPAAALDRRVIARTAPPRAAVPIASRIQAIERNGSQPLAVNQLRPAAGPRGANPAAAAAASRVQVVGRGNAAQPQPLPLRGAAVTRADAATARAAQQPVRGAPANAAQPPTRGTPATPGTRGPVTAPVNPAAQRGPDARNPATQPATPATGRGSLPSSRFAPQRRGDPETGAAANPARVNTPAVRGNPTTQDSRVNPAARTTPNAAQSPNRNVQQGTSPNAQRTPERQMTTPTRTAPAVQQRTVPQTPAREVQQQQRETRQAPVQQQREPRQAPVQQQRSVPQTQVREAPQREMRQPQVQREVQPQRSAPAQQVREAPQQQMRQPAPQQQQRPAPAAREQAPPREQPRERGKKDDDDKNRR